MIDRALGIIGIAVTIIASVMPALIPELDRRIAWRGFFFGMALLFAAAVTFFLPSGASDGNAGRIDASHNRGIITQDQRGNNEINK